MNTSLKLIYKIILNFSKLSKIIYITLINKTNMKKFMYLFLASIILFAFGCDNKESDSNDITGQVIIVDDSVIVEDVLIIEEKEGIIIEEIVENITTVRLCHDTDNGIVRWVNGSIFGYHNDSTRFELNDYCFNNNILIEYYCEDETPQNYTFLCKNGCADDHCL